MHKSVNIIQSNALQRKKTESINSRIYNVKLLNAFVFGLYVIFHSFMINYVCSFCSRREKGSAIQSATSSIIKASPTEVD